LLGPFGLIAESPRPEVRGDRSARDIRPSQPHRRAEIGPQRMEWRRDAGRALLNYFMLRNLWATSLIFAAIAMSASVILLPTSCVQKENDTLL
jgi:hypothetical protein